MAEESSTSDVRMRGFARRSTVDDAQRWVDQHTAPLPSELVGLLDAGGRVLAGDIIADVDVPLFDRAMMDGFALRADDTLGASAGAPVTVTVIGQVLPGDAARHAVQPGQAVRIMTGAAMPGGADAVLPVEHCVAEGSTVRVLRSIAPGKNVGRRGEDIAHGEKVLDAGRRLRPQDLGVLSSLGAAQLTVIRRPRVRIVATGNELLPPGSRPEANKIVDANTPMLMQLICRDGGEPITRGITADRPEAIGEALGDEADVILVSGGTSVGQEDFAPQLLAQRGELAIHGIAMRPGGPAGMGRLDGRLVFLLPGNPVSCLAAYDFFAGRAIRRLAGLPTEWPYPVVRRPLAKALESVVGRVDYARVQFVDDQVEPLAIGGASSLSSTTRASGFVVIPPDCDGYPAGTMLEVHLYDPC